MTRREALGSAALIVAVAVAVRIWAASFLTFPQPEDTAYYVGVAGNLVSGRGLVSDAIWSYGTPPLTFPRSAFEVWLPLPSFLASVPMAALGPSLGAAQVSSIVVGAIVAVLAWRLGADAAAERALPAGRARTLALGAGLTTATYLPLVLASAEPDSTIVFAALALGACLLMARLAPAPGPRTGTGTGSDDLRPKLVLLGVLLGLAALTRNEAIWLAATWAIVAWRAAGAGRRRWLGLVGLPALVGLAIYLPWSVRDWLAFGSPLPGQAIVNALSLDGRDIFAWSDPPTVSRYLAAGPATLLGLRWTGFVHNLVNVLLALGLPVSAIGLAGLPGTARSLALRPVVLFSLITFATTTLLFPVATTWGTFLHAAGAIHVLLIVSALLALDGLLAAIARRRTWTRPVAWLGPTLTIGAALLFSATLLPAQGVAARAIAARYAALPAALAAAGAPLPDDGRPVITDFPVWLAEATGHRALALPNEPPASVLDLAAHFGGAPLLIVSTANEGIWPEALASGEPGADCFQRVPLVEPADRPDALKDVAVFRIGCP